MTALLQSEKDSKEEILKAFRLFDADDKGKITFRDLKRVAKELAEDLTDEEVSRDGGSDERGPSRYSPESRACLCCCD